MFPFLPWTSNQANIRSALSAPTPSISSSSTISSFSYGDSLFPSASSSMPPPAPPSSPTDSLLDITPRKSSFSNSFGMNAACAFPSWPNRPSLISADSDSSTASAYLSDEDLYTDSPLPSEPGVEEESAAHDPVFGAVSMTTEQRIQQLRQEAEEQEHRARFLAQVQAHARAQQALRVSQLSTAERENAKRKKRRAVPEKKRRTISSPSKARY